jgi:hypothetical protein
MKRKMVISFKVDKYDLAYYEDLAKECLKEASDYGYSSDEFIFHFIPQEDGSYIIEMYEEGCVVEIRNDYLYYTQGKVLKDICLDDVDELTITRR